MGQLFDADILDKLADPPVMSAGVELQDEKLYTIILAGFFATVNYRYNKHCY